MLRVEKENFHDLGMKRREERGGARTLASLGFTDKGAGQERPRRANSHPKPACVLFIFLGGQWNSKRRLVLARARKPESCLTARLQERRILKG